MRGLYAALAAGDREGVLGRLHPGFVAQFADGMPVGGGRADGPQEALEHWWAIGRAFAVVAEPEEVWTCADGRLVVRGRYRGHARDDAERVVDAAFAHFWTVAEGRLVQLHQVTDTARWGTPLRPRADPA